MKQIKNIKNIILIALMLLSNSLYSQVGYTRSQSVNFMIEREFEVFKQCQNNIEFRQDTISVVLFFNRRDICKGQAIIVKGADFNFWEVFLEMNDYYEISQNDSKLEVLIEACNLEKKDLIKNKFYYNDKFKQSALSILEKTEKDFILWMLDLSSNDKKKNTDL